MVKGVSVDICTETSMMSSHLALLRRGHIDSIFHMFFYLKKHQNSDILFDTSDPDIGMDDLHRE